MTELLRRFQKSLLITGTSLDVSLVVFLGEGFTETVGAQAWDIQIAAGFTYTYPGPVR